MNGFLKKAGLGVVLAATTVATVAPADAQRWRGGYGRHWHGNRGGNAAAAGLLGGIIGLGVGAAIASNNRDRYYDRGYYNDGYYRAPPRVVYREQYYAPPPPPRVVYRDTYYGGGYADPYYGY